MDLALDDLEVSWTPGWDWLAAVAAIHVLAVVPWTTQLGLWPLLELIKSYSRSRPETTCAVEELRNTVSAVDNAILRSKVIKLNDLIAYRNRLYEQFIKLSDSTIDETTDVISESGDTRDGVRKSCQRTTSVPR